MVIYKLKNSKISHCFVTLLARRDVVFFELLFRWILRRKKNELKFIIWISFLVIHYIQGSRCLTHKTRLATLFFFSTRCSNVQTTKPVLNTWLFRGEELRKVKSEIFIVTAFVFHFFHLATLKNLEAFVVFFYCLFDAMNSSLSSSSATGPSIFLFTSYFSCWWT